MTQSQQLRKLAARSATAFLLAALCVFPLYIDKFSNLGVVKFTGICTLSWAFALWLGALACVGARPDPGRLPWKADPALWALGAVTASGVVSTVLSLSPGASFWGLGGYYGGCMMVLFTAAGYLTIRAFAPQKILNGLTFCVGVTTALVTVLYVLNIFNIDLIGTYANTAVVERAQFFSTLGQKNFCSGFMAFALPLVFYAFLVARGPRHTVFYGIPAFFGGLALAVVFDSIQAAKARGTDVVIIDTAGRLHNKTNLMNELNKITRVIRRELPEADIETLMVLDATTGQNGLIQAKQFLDTADLTGIVLTKLDGTAKGGIVFAIANDLQLPVKYVGVGEQIDDLLEFKPAEFVEALLS